MSWDAYCNLPSATSAVISGVDGTQWGKKGDWKTAKADNLKMVNAKIGSMVTLNGNKFMIVNKSGEVFFGVKGDNAVVIRILKKCFLAAVGPKAKQGGLIDEILKFSASLEKGGY
mmetsp:Transcript_4648/g.6934  ORF Transcript_4648/g.6934 Transcript_4648/m.6934 type:complete len:115 (+) Transcript_4648:224-568(+)